MSNPDFEEVKGTEWQANGDATIVRTEDDSHHGNWSLLVSNR